MDQGGNPNLTPNLITVTETELFILGTFYLKQGKLWLWKILKLSYQVIGETGAGLLTPRQSGMFQSYQMLSLMLEHTPTSPFSTDGALFCSRPQWDQISFACYVFRYKEQ